MKRDWYIHCIAMLIFFAVLSCGHKSGRKKSFNNNPSITRNKEVVKDSRNKTIVKMENENGVKYVWIEINGLKLRFIFDTGASNICISSKEATELYKQGTLQKEDILDVQYFQDATGDVSAGTRINLKTVKIGDKLLNNIEAIVIDKDQVPLLLGQSALEKFGKISIDNKNGEISFE